jgi:hypothetical protein
MQWAPTSHPFRKSDCDKRVFWPEFGLCPAVAAWLSIIDRRSSTKWKGVLSFNISTTETPMTAYIHYHPRPAPDAASRVLTAVAIGFVLVILGVVVGTIA